jgi:hypothetical protein
MDHTMIQDPPGFSDLSKEEQVLYIQALWDRIFGHPDDLPVPAWHLELVEERIAEYRRNPTPLRSAYDVLDELANQSR